MERKLDALFFLHCIQSATHNTVYDNFNFKPKQILCLESLFYNRDTLAILPTGYGKSVTFHILPHLLQARNSQLQKSSNLSIVLVVSPLNSLMNDQIDVLQRSNIKAAVLNVKRIEDEDLERQLDTNADLSDLNHGRISILFCHPEAFLSCPQGLSLLQSTLYTRNVTALVVDEAHCILEWGSEFRKDYSRLGVLTALFPKIPMYALTATATKKDRQKIMSSLCMRDVKVVIGELDRPNIFLEKFFRGNQDEEALLEILKPIAKELEELKVNYPITIIFLPLRWCGYAYRYLEYILGKKQYFPEGADPIPKNRLFEQYHAPQTQLMKDEIMTQLSSCKSTVRVIFATVAIGMGVNIPNIRNIIHVGVPGSARQYFQEIGRCGRDGMPGTAKLYYNNRDISSNKPGMTDEMRAYCKSFDKCLRVQILTSLDAPEARSVLPGHLCCSACKGTCVCMNCKMEKQLAL